MQRKSIDDGFSGSLNKCPNCGSAEIIFDASKSLFVCTHCRTSFLSTGAIEEPPIETLTGVVLSEHLEDVTEQTDMITFKCSGCGAEVVVDSNAHLARCHWCRQSLTLDNVIQNGLVPDTVLTFSITKAQAKTSIRQFINQRSFFALPHFKQTFNDENIFGVYFPYAVIDFNVHADLEGSGEVLTRKYTVKVGKSTQTRYDADVYTVKRRFDAYIDNLTIESKKERVKTTDRSKTNNIINSIMPFDLENALPWQALYLKGYSSEKRNLNVEQLKDIVQKQAEDVTRYSIVDDLAKYTRGVSWSTQNYEIKGQRWTTAYLPVWLYSYQDKNKVIHYIAVNGRTKETMGSVPINAPLVFLMALLIEIVMLMIALNSDSAYAWLLLFLGPLFAYYEHKRYRNPDARHHFETDTKTRVDNIERVDEYVTHRHGQTSSTIVGMNYTKVTGISK